MGAGRWASRFALSSLGLVACTAERCDPVVAYNPGVDDVVIDSGIGDVDFEELRLYPKRYVERRVRARGWLSFGVHSYGTLDGISVAWSPEQQDWFRRELNDQPFYGCTQITATVCLSERGQPYFCSVSEITQAECPKPNRRYRLIKPASR